jgi:biopolymer transport protein ExbB
MHEIWNIWVSGGVVMVPLFALAVVLYAQAFQLLLYLRRTNLSGAGEMQWYPERAEGRVGEIIRYTQSDVSSVKQVRRLFEEVRLMLLSLIDRRLTFVGILVGAAPLMGLLGTVFGMLRTFFGISSSGGAETASVVASGISEALVTTQAGLTVALPGLFLVMLIRRRRHQLEARLARLESLTLSHLKFE